ncbi:hypothetical protein DH2020_011559 [Rehmannia glutinosa]|uniref:Nucleobase-ascorbate transporter-like protein n=1 Tax=Rehmannia glutinosa TaxID=99300 RepID=A0ABR0XDU0_REHGL
MGDITHPPMEQLQDLEFCIDSNPPWPQTILLGFQNYIVMLGTSVMIPTMLVPLMGGSDADKARVVQTLLFVAGINTLLQTLFGTRLPAVVGGSFAYVIPIAYIINDSSLQRIHEPHLLGNCVEIGLPMLFLVVGLSQASESRTIDVQSHSFAMMSAVLVSMVESTGAYKAAARLAIATPPPAYVLSRGIGWQGIAILFDGLFGTGSGSTVSVENVGLLGLTRVGSRRVVQVSAAFMLSLSVFGKFGAIFASIPFTIFAGLYCVLFGLVGSVGLSFLQFTNMNSMRNLFISGLSLFLGISIPQFFGEYWTPHGGLFHTRAGWFNAIFNTIFMSPPTIALIVAVFLDNTLEVEKSGKDRGMPWWVKFRTFKGDNRNEEFYNLPFNLNRFFPPT